MDNTSFLSQDPRKYFYYKLLFCPIRTLCHNHEMREPISVPNSNLNFQGIRHEAEYVPFCMKQGQSATECNKQCHPVVLNIHKIFIQD
jgi:hypothetical protein